MTIKRSNIEIVDFGEGDYTDDNDDTKKSYCKHCLEYGFKVPLQNRIYQNEPIPPDDERSKWVQCHDCGLIVPIYELEKESQIKNVVDTLESPFELGSDFLGVDSRKLGKKKRKQNEYDYIQDEQLKQELRKGSTLLSYSEQIPH